jgi:hypothetical protein
MELNIRVYGGWITLIFLDHEFQLTLFGRIEHPPSQTSTTQYNIKP